MKTPDNYRGSRLLQPVATAVGLQVDMINFLLCQVVALVLAVLYRKYLPAHKTSVTIRHVVALSVGVILGYFCFGWQMLHLFSLGAVTYGMMICLPVDIMHVAVLSVSMIYMSAMHIFRMIYDYGGYSLDITGPLMIAVQKVSSMAFCYHDGKVKDESKLSKDQKQQAIRNLPSPLEYYSYIFYFQGLLVGPLCFYPEYKSYMQGTNYTPRPLKDKEEEKPKTQTIPSPKIPVVQKVMMAIVCLAAMMIVAPVFSMTKHTDEEHASGGWIYRIFFMIVSCFLGRAKYYFAWIFGDAICNASGLGFNGYSEDGSEKWDLISNVDVWKLETATSLKVILDNWNIMTTVWLRRLVYERMPFQKTLVTYTLSACWHGFYPGYYFTFVGGAFFTVISRLVRYNIRPKFQDTSSKRLFYDVVTWFFAQLSLAYLVVPFVLYEFKPVIYYYNSFYWFLHVGCLVFYIILPSRPRRPKPSTDSATTTTAQLPRESNATSPSTQDHNSTTLNSTAGTDTAKTK